MLQSHDFRLIAHVLEKTLSNLLNKNNLTIQMKTVNNSCRYMNAWTMHIANGVTVLIYQILKPKFDNLIATWSKSCLNLAGLNKEKPTFRQ